MVTTRYAYDVNLNEINDPHSLAVLSVPPRSRVLDLGAADGSVARALSARGCTVWAVERDSRAADAAADVCERVICADLEGPEAWKALEGESFDAILALDVLEHLRDPKAVLARAPGLLKPKGIVVVSLPNITRGAVRLSLLDGQFPYTDLGLLDRTHLRFFDRRGAERLMVDAGLVVTDRLRVSRALDATEIAIDTGSLRADLLERLAQDPDATTYQFVFVAQSATGSEPHTVDASLVARLLSELEAQRLRFAEVEVYARNLASERESLLEKEAGLNERLAEQTKFGHELDEVRRELTERMRELHQRHLELRHCKSDLAVKQAFIDMLRGEVRATKDYVANELVRHRVDNERMQQEVAALRAYSSSAGFRLVERSLSVLRRVPFVFSVTRSAVRTVAGKPRE